MSAAGLRKKTAREDRETGREAEKERMSQARSVVSKLSSPLMKEMEEWHRVETRSVPIV
jgi:hypothetical protein